MVVVTAGVLLEVVLTSATVVVDDEPSDEQEDRAKARAQAEIIVFDIMGDNICATAYVVRQARERGGCFRTRPSHTLRWSST